MRAIVFSALVLASSLSLAGVTGSVEGEVTTIRVHQYLNNSAWDEAIWFCVNDSTVIGECGVTSGCGNGGRSMPLVITKDAHPSVYSTVLAASMSGTSIKVHVDDSVRLENACVARMIDVQK